ncbi:MAG: preprotein translocase subunit SecA [Segetibacter sp.]|nr:preprotein translocase subunit SecA [Segetibacter sp.]
MAIQLTTELLKADMPYPFAKASKKKFEQVFKLFEKGNKKAISEILKAAALYPQLPQFLNLAAQYFDQADMQEEKMKIMQDLKEKFPLFLFWRINESMDAFLKKDAEKMHELLGEELRLESLYPARKLFHTSEYLGYTRAVMLYYSLRKDETQLLKRMAEAEHLKKKFPFDTKILYQIAMTFLVENSSAGKIEAPVLPAIPGFQIKEVEELFNRDLTIPDELYDSILSKDRKLLIEDLEKLLQHGIDNYRTYNKKNVPNKNTYFVWHALFLLKDIEASESLPAVLNFLKQDEELVEFYLGDLISDFLWELLYALADQDVRALVDFIKTLRDNYLLRSEIILTLKQIALHHPERTVEIESYLRELLLYVSTISDEEDVFIEEVTDTLLETIGELALTRLFPEVERLLKEDMLPVIYGIDWEEFENRYVSEKFDSNKVYQELRTRKEVYTEYLEAQEEHGDDDDDEWDDDEYDDVDEYLDALDSNDAYEDSVEDDDEKFEDNEDDFEKDDTDDEDTKDKSYIDYQELNTPYVKKEPDVGRNDPCPCGSGKKYKKCHGKS